MNSCKYIAILLLITCVFTACTGNQSNKTLGNTSDTAAVLGAKDTSSATATDSVGKDSSNSDNANPTGHTKP